MKTDSSFFGWLGGWLLQRRAWVLGILGLLSVVGAALIPSLGFDFRPEAMLQFDDREDAFARDFAARYGNDDNLLLVVVRARQGDMLGPEGLSLLYRATARAEGSEAVAGVYSLVRVPRREVSSGLALLTGAAPPPLVQGLPVSEADAAQVRDAVRASMLLRGQLISQDGVTALLILSLKPEYSAPLRLDAPLSALEAELRELCADRYELHLGGLPYVRTETVRNMKSEQLVLWPAVGAIYFFLMWIVFRRLGQALLPLAAVGAATLWSVGLMSAVGQAVNLINNTLPTMILVIGVCNAIHVLLLVMDKQRAGLSQAEALRDTVREIGLACFLTTLTTAVGFGSLVVARAHLLRDFGWLTAAGVMFTYVAIIALLPALCTLFTLTPAARHTREGGAGERASAALAGFLARAPWAWIGGAVLLLAGFLYVGVQVPVDAKVIDAFEEGHPVVEANRLIERELGGILPLEIDLQLAPGQAQKAETLQRLARLEAQLAARPGVLSTLSVIGMLREAGMSGPGGPSSDAQAAAGLALLRRAQPQALARQMTEDGAGLRLSIRLPDEGVQHALEQVQATERLTAEAFPPGTGVRHRLTGAAYLSAIGLDVFVRDLFYSLITATAIIFVVLVVFFRSIPAGFLSLLPNLVPLSATLAALPLFGYTLNTTTVVVFTISIGMSVDNSIHIIARFREVAPGAPDIPTAIRETFRGAGRAVAFSNLLLIGGFAVLLLSGFEPIRRVGVLTMTTIGAALVSVFLIMPAQLALFGRWLLPRKTP